MKFIICIISLIFFINIATAIESESKHKLNTFNLDINVDYNQATQTIDQLKILQADYLGLKQKIVQNETKDYAQCLDFVVQLQCQKADIWQAAIQELQIENKNSQEVQIPFLQTRKASKVEKLKELLEITNESDQQKEKVSEELEGNKKKVQGAVDLLQELYSVTPKAEFVQRFSKQMKDLSAMEIKNHIQNSANLLQMKNQQEQEKPEEQLNEQVDQELNTAHLEYLEKDQQIQAQTTVNVIKSSESKITEALNFLSQSHDSKSKELKLEKSALKEDIEELRTQIQEFEEKVKHNQEKIEELQGKVQACANKPQNKEHDCDPIKSRAKKELIDVEMMLNRLNLIEEQLKALMEGKEQVSKSSSEDEQKRKQLLQEQMEGDNKVKEILENKNMVHPEAEFELKGSYKDVGAEAIGDRASNIKKQDEGISEDIEEKEIKAVGQEIKDDMQLQDRKKEFEFKKGTIEYDGSYLKDLKGYKKYDD